MNKLLFFDQLHAQTKNNRWMQYFTVFCRVGLAAGFIPSGIVKIMGERFTSLSVNHPMGHYLEALHHTSYYYTFIGILQVTAAILLLIPRVATLGAIIYFPIILNICLLSIAVRFEGSLLSSPLMVLANLYLLCWDYDKLKYLLPLKQPLHKVGANDVTLINNKFPIYFFCGVVLTIAAVAFTLTHVFDIMPRNTLTDCQRQCSSNKNPQGCEVFCDCIHNQGQPLEKALDTYHKAARFKSSKQPDEIPQ